MPTPPASPLRKTLWILNEQLSDVALQGSSPADTDVVMIESIAELSRLPIHKKRLVLELAAQRHHAEALEARGWQVFYFAEQPDWSTGLAELRRRRGAGTLHLVETLDPTFSRELAAAALAAGFDVEIRPGPANLLRAPELDRAAESGGPALLAALRAQLVLPDGAAVPIDEPLPSLPLFPRSTITRKVMAMVDRRFASHFGTTEGFNLPVTASQATELLDHFLLARLPGWLSTGLRGSSDGCLPFHSMLAPYLGLGLLTAEAVIERCRELVSAGRLPVPAAAEFLDRVIGSREFVHRVSRRRARQTALPSGSFPLPTFFHNGDVSMVCLAEAIRELDHRGFHADTDRRRLLETFFLIAETEADASVRWLESAYLRPEPPTLIEAEQRGAGECCERCAYDPDAAIGNEACPYNLLLADFLARHRGSPSLPGIDAHELGLAARAIRKRITQPGRVPVADSASSD